MPEPSGLPTSLRVYILTIAILGPAICLVVALAGGVWTTNTQLAVALMLVVMAAAADRYQVNLSHQTSINVAGAAYVTMIVVLPVGAPGLLALAAIALGHLLRRAEPIEAVFNVGQGALHVVAGGAGVLVGRAVRSGRLRLGA